MGKKLYVGNLPYTAKDEDLRGLFAQFGDIVEIQIITDRETGRSKGFGFVEMQDDAAALKAVEALNGQEMQGRPLVVNEARPREERSPRTGGGRSFGGNRRGGDQGGYSSSPRGF